MTGAEIFERTMAAFKANHLLQAEFGVPPFLHAFENKRTGYASRRIT